MYGESFVHLIGSPIGELGNFGLSDCYVDGDIINLKFNNGITVICQDV